jgi:signal transduction histidine kinase
MAWVAGVRPGDAYTRWPDGSGGDVATSGVEVGIPDSFGVWLWPTALIDVALAAVLLPILWFAPLAGRAGLVLVAAFATGDLHGGVAAPAAWAILATPAMALIILTLDAPRAVRPLLGVVALASLAVVLLLAAGTATLTFDVGWWIGATIPALAVVLLGLIALAAALVRHISGSPRRVPLPAALVRRTAAGRQAVRLAEEAERDQHARWLHDSVMPRLHEGVMAVEAGNPAMSSAALRSLINDVRSEMDHSQLAILEWGGVVAALEGAASQVRARGLACAFDLEDLGGRPPWNVELAAWRIVQEALGNAFNHASADRIDLHAIVGGRVLVIEIADDGVGLDDETVAEARRTGHIGIVSIQARADEVGASLSMYGREPSGTTVRFEWRR